MSNKKEIIAGAAAFFIAVVAFVLIGGRNKTASMDNGSYVLSARFNYADGLNVGAPVRVAGVKVGKVVAERLDNHYGVVVTFTLPRGVELPDDSSASIQSDSLFGGKIIEIRPGGGDQILVDGDVLSFTEDSFNLENLLDKVIAMAKADRAKQKKCN